MRIYDMTFHSRFRLITEHHSLTDYFSFLLSHSSVPIIRLCGIRMLLHTQIFYPRRA
jgi:hypothetical protein